MLAEPLRIPLEQLVSRHIGRAWVVREVTDLHDFASHPAAILGDGGYAVFAKYSAAANSFEQFEVEMASLRFLSERAGALIPTLIGNIQAALFPPGNEQGKVRADGGTVLVQEAVQPVERGPVQWRQIGQALARLHQVHWEHCGLETNGYFGSLYQDNRPLPDWCTFFAERRLWPRLMSAVDSGRLDSTTIRQVEKLISRLPVLCGPEPVPSLLHGDAQQNNYISTEYGAVIIDPAVCFGNPEFDLAYIDYFQPVPGDVLDGYQEVLPIDAGFPERRDLWRVYGYLSAVTVEGGIYLDLLQSAVRKYL
jgi:protein-ribulosamine 3-kinase